MSRTPRGRTATEAAYRHVGREFVPGAGGAGGSGGANGGQSRLF